MPDEITTPETTTPADDIELTATEAAPEAEATPIEEMSLDELEAATRPGADEAEASTDETETEDEPSADETEGEDEGEGDEEGEEGNDEGEDAEGETIEGHPELPIEPTATHGNASGEIAHPEGAPAVSQPTYEVPNPDAERPEDAPVIPGNEPGLDEETAAAIEAPAPTSAPSLTEPAAEANEGEGSDPTDTDTGAEAPVSDEASSDEAKGAPVAAGPTVPALSPIQQIRADAPGAERPLSIEEQMSPGEAARLAPLSAAVVDESRPAHDAVPAEAQATMAAQRLSADADLRSPLQQLPASAPQAGTIEDPTGISYDLTSPKVASHMTQGYDAGTAFEKALDPEANPTDTLSPPTELPAKDSEGEDSSDAASDEADAGGSEASDEGGEAEGGIYGDVKAFYAPMMDYCGEGFDAVKQAAESANSAAGQLSQVPATLLDLDHRNVMFRMQEILAELVVLTDRIYHRN